MSLENPRKEPSERKRFMEFEGKQFEVVDIDALQAQDIKPGDRTIISTESGNRYMLRFSKSAKAPKVYSERTKFEDGYELFNKYDDEHPTVAEIGKPFEFTMITDKKKNLGQPFTSTPVTAIEIRCGLDDAIENNPRQVSGSDMASMITEQFKAKPRIDKE
jgi:hypothetical protein